MNELRNIICLRWTIGSCVRIRAIDECGTVYSATVSKDGLEYCVKWFGDGGTRNQDWFLEAELEPA